MDIEEALSITNNPTDIPLDKVAEAINLVNNYNHPNLKQSKLFPTLLPEKSLNLDKLAHDFENLPATAAQKEAIRKLGGYEYYYTKLTRKEAQNILKTLSDKRKNRS